MPFFENDLWKQKLPGFGVAWINILTPGSSCCAPCWIESDLIFIQSTPPFVHFTPKFVESKLLGVRIMGNTDGQILFLCQGAYSVLSHCNILSSIEFAFLLK